MATIYCIMGKSSSGKDTIYKRLLAREELGLKNIVTYTTRPIRSHETDGVEYHFCDEAEEERLYECGRIVERRIYNTHHGRWSYFTVDDGQIGDNGHYILIGTIDSYLGLKTYYTNHFVVPIYIEVEDGIRLQRAIDRERKQEFPKYEEMCRRFLADSVDFSAERLEKAGIQKDDIFANFGREVDDTVEEIAAFIADKSDR